MAVVKHIGLVSALKIGFAVYALLGLLAGLACSTVALAGIPFGHYARIPTNGLFALLPLVLCPLLYGVMGAIVTLLGALFYDLASRFVGGLEVDIR